MVDTQEDKDNLITFLRNQGLVQVNDAKQECILGMPVDKFVHVGELRAEYWS